MAAIELGRNELAFWDLKVAINKEVAIQLDKVKNCLSNRRETIHQSGLGKRLSQPRKYTRGNFVNSGG